MRVIRIEWPEELRELKCLGAWMEGDDGQVVVVMPSDFSGTPTP